MRSRTTFVLLVATLCAVVSSRTAAGQAPDPPEAEASAPPLVADTIALGHHVLAPPVRVGDRVHWGSVVVHDTLLARLVATTADRSPVFRDALARLAAAPRPLHVGTHTQLRSLCPGSCGPFSAFAEAVVRPAALGTMPRVLVRVNLELLTHFYDALGEREHLETDLQAMLAHELAGHALGALEQVGGGRRCEDSLFRGGVLDRVGCAVRRENQVRRELGLPPRRDYRGMDSRFTGSWEAVQAVHLNQWRDGRFDGSPPILRRLAGLLLGPLERLGVRPAAADDDPRTGAGAGCC